MYAKKANKVYRVDDVTKDGYLKQGYDICDDSGNIIEHSAKATIPYAEYEKVLKELSDTMSELETIKAELKNIKSSDRQESKKKTESKSG